MTFDFKQIDADSHVQETGGSWELYLAEEYKDRRPAVIENPYVSGRPLRDKTWYIDGRLVPKNQGSGAVVMSTPAEMSFAKKKPVAVPVQACTDPLERVEYMRRANVHRTVMFSTLFLETVTDDLVYEAALMRAWNTWASEMCKQSPEHLAFGAVVPVRDPGLAVRELRHAKELGACTVMVLPTAGRHHLHERFLDPFWAEAQHLDMPVSVHIGWPNPDVVHDCTSPCAVFLGAFETSMWWAYLSVFAGGILDRFPKLRVGFFENDCRWFEIFVARALHWQPTTAAFPWPAKRSVKDYLAEAQVFFSYEGDFAALPRFLDLVCDDKVMAAMDFPHTHYGTANLSEALDFVRNHEHLTPARKRKLLRDNALAFFGWKDE